MNNYFEIAKALFDVYVSTLGLFITLIYWIGDIEFSIKKISFHKKSLGVFPYRVKTSQINLY